MADPKTRVVITAEDKTAAGLRSAETALSGFAGRFVSLTSPLALAGTAIAAGSAALVASVKSAIDTGDQFNKLSQKTGIAVESLSALAYAGDLSGVSIDALAGGIKKLSVNMSDAASSTSGKAAEAFNALGISVTDANGALRSSEDVLKQVADSFANMKDGAGKTALAVALFGKAGADLIPLLNQGSKGLADLTEEAEKLGLVMTGKTAKAAEEFNDNIRKLSLSTAALGRSITAGLIGPLAEYTRLMVEARKEGAGFFGAMAVGLRKPDGNAPLDELRERAGVLQGRISQATGATDFILTSRAAADRAELAILQKQIKERLAGSQEVIPPFAAGGLANAPAIGDGGESAATKAAKKEKAELDRMLALGRRNLADGIDSEEDMQKVGQRRALESAQAAKREADQVEQMRQKYIELADPLQKYRVQLDEINQLRASGQLTAAQALEAEWNINEALDATADKMEEVKGAGTDTFADLTRAVEGWGNAFTDTLADMVMGGKANFTDLANSIIRDLLRIQIQKNVTQPLVDAGSSFLDGLFKTGIGSIFGGARAGGGGVDPSKFYLVGERGPELFAPGASGSIIPNHAMSGPPVVVNIIEDPNRGGQIQQRNDGGQNVLDVFVERVKSAIAGDIARGSGAVPAAMESTYGMNRAAGAF